MATTDFIAAIELSTSKIVGIAGKKNSDGSIQVLAYAQEHGTPCIRKGGIYNIDKTVQALRSIIHKLESQLDSSIAKVYTSINGQSLRTLENSVSRTLDEEQIISQELVDEMCDDNLNMPLSDQTILDVVPQEYRMDNNTLQSVVVHTVLLGYHIQNGLVREWHIQVVVTHFVYQLLGNDLFFIQGAADRIFQST